MVCVFTVAAIFSGISEGSLRSRVWSSHSQWKSPFWQKKVQSNRLLNTHGLKGVKKFKPLCNMHCLLSRMNGKHKLNMIWLSFLWFPLLSPILITFKLKRKTTLTTCLFSILLLFQLINIIIQLLHPEDKI